MNQIFSLNMTHTVLTASDAGCSDYLSHHCPVYEKHQLQPDVLEYKSAAQHMDSDFIINFLSWKVDIVSHINTRSSCFLRFFVCFVFSNLSVLKRPALRSAGTSPASAPTYGKHSSCLLCFFTHSYCYLFPHTIDKGSSTNSVVSTS